MNDLLQDIRYAFRSIAKAPGFAAVVIVTVVVAACPIPARRTAAVDPMVALRAD